MKKSLMNTVRMNTPFNIACAKYMGIDYYLVNESVIRKDTNVFYNPHDNLNELAPVMDEIIEKHGYLASKTVSIAHGLSLGQKKIKQVMIDFVSINLGVTT